MMSSLYERLDENDIRLLTVLHHDGATASLELRTYPRSSAPEYDAVSYTWGADKATTAVTCNDRSFDIQTNLFMALSFLKDARPKPRTRPFWVDAICVNQADKLEKAAHVPLMHEVYTNAARTLIWLGEADHHSDLAIDNIDVLKEKLQTIKGLEDLSVRQKLAKYGLPPPDGKEWEAVKSFQQRPWFFRLWTFQEVILSREPIFVCGSKSISWTALLALRTAALEAGLNSMVILASDHGSNAQYAITHVDFLRTQKAAGGFLSLPMLIKLSADRGYSLPVDRAWALLGLLNKKYRELIQAEGLIDYSDEAVMDYHKTFLGVAKFHIKYDTYTAMQIIEDNLRIKPHPSLPSWCPDFHTESGKVPLSRSPHATAGMPGMTGFKRIESFMKVNDDSSLELCGLLVDTVECVTASAADDVFETESYPWLCECIDIVNSTKFVHFDVYPENANIPPVPETWEGGEPISAQRRKYRQAEEVLKYVLYPPGLVAENLRNLQPCNDRKFFRTRATRLGIGPADIRENDVICVMYGARTAWALRPHNPPQDVEHGAADGLSKYSEDQVFEFLGSVHTPSLSKGQAWSGKSCESMRRFKLI